MLPVAVLGAGSPEAGQATAAARLIGISKRFGGVQALSDVSIELRRGEVHALLGENGAGKTTLMRILAGIIPPDAGTVEIGGRRVRLRSRREAARYRIGMIQQHFALIDELTAAENHVLADPDGGALTDVRRAARELREHGERLGLTVRPEAPVGGLTMGERQRLEIVSAVAAGAEVLIMDEPTAALGVEDADLVGEIARRLAADGRAVVYITHKLREVFEVSDRVSVLKRGRLVASMETGSASADQLAEAMVDSVPRRRQAEHARPTTQPVARLRGVWAAADRRRRGIEDVSLTVHRGEVVGIAGVIGNGQDALAAVLTGLLPPLRGEFDPRPAQVAYIPEDRARDALATELSVRDNAIVHKHRDPSLRRWGRLASAPVTEFVRRLLANAQIRIPSQGTAASSLSGGNQQRLVLARELDRAPDLIVAHNPYRGLDIGATADVRERILAARDRGAGVVLISADLDEILDIADRIAVLFEGRVVGEIDGREADAHQLGRLMAGAT